ncbi:hypothetical protein [Legionella waltersii]|uniref:FlaG protein n=1 Tax=Legionella waltersii TaxID=66969 RepID=A0A0W1ALX8_9GAMM|nr:hypothetical protein [Legionella waltersii]KTD82357.1 hypothetical protein Lwal_0834 [Legionella waltersii]SNV03853.1 Uncharacterised protein [Legionella waltersii]
MNIDRIQPINQVTQTEPVSSSEETSESSKPISVSHSFLDAETKQVLDKATGLLQTIVTDKMSDKVLRKMPPDEYLNLLGLLDEIISGSINKQV